MKVDARQIIDRDLLARTTGASGSQTDTMFTALNSEITPPLAFSVTGANRIVTIGNITVFNPSTNLNRTVPPISQLLPAFASGTVTLDATGAGNATPSVGTTLALAMVASRFMRIGVSIDAIGSLSLTKGTQGATLATATTPAVPSGLFGIGHIVVRTDASNNVANVLTSDIYQYMGGGGGTSGDANSILETLKNELVDSSYQNVTPSIAAQQAATLVSSFSGTGSYGVADQTYLFPAIADSLTSVQMLDEQEFIGNNPTDISKSLAFLSWRSSYIDPLATVQISRNAGTNYYPVTMSRVGANTETFSGEYEWTREEEAADALDSFSTNNTQTELTNVAGVTESVSSLFTLAVNQGVQLRIKNISVKLSRLGTLVGNYRFAIFNSSSSLPSARLFTGAWQTASTVSTSAVDISLSTDLNNVYIDDNTPYHVVIETDDTYKAGFSTGVNALRVHRSTASGSGASTLDGATWTAVAASQVNRIITYAAELFTSLDTDVTATTDEDQLNAFSSIANDSAFYTNLGTGFNNTVTAFAIQTDGKILVCGSFTTLNDITRNRLVRLNSNGTEDTAFYTNLGTGFNIVANAFAIQTDGKILVCGSFTTLNGNTRNRLVRLNSDGTEDTAFYTNLGTGFNNVVSAIAIQTDGKILVGGYFTTLNGNTRNRLVRLNSDGTHDAAFYTNLGTGFDNHVTNVVLQTDGKILVGGWFTTLNAITRNRLVRLNSDGTHDAAFYTNLGSAFGNNWTVAITVQTDGKILVGGYFTLFNGNTRNRLIRLNSTGTEDTAFYTNLGSAFNDAPSQLAVQTDGKILVGGYFTTLNGNTRNRLVRLNSDGTHDAAFYTNLGTGFDNHVTNVVLQTDGKILVGGWFTTLNAITRNRLVRLNSDGTHDAAFYTNLGSAFGNNWTVAITVQTDGKILVGGYFTLFNGNTRNRLIRLNSTGTEDTAFYTALTSAGNASGFADTPNIIAVQTDGKILVGGAFLALNGITRMRLVRLGPVNYSQIGSQFTVATGTAYAVKKAMLRLKRTGTVSGNIFYKIVRDSAGVPSALSSDVVAVSNLVAASTISTSNVDTSIRFGTSVIGPGTYHIVLASDATYIASFSAGVNYIGIQRYTGAASSLSALFDGTAWYEHTSTFRYAYTLSGRPVDLRIKITSGTVLTQLAAFAAFYEIGTPIAGGRKNFDKKFFKSQADNLSSFSINFVPDPDLLRVYRIGTGQVFKYPDFTFSGSTITFPTNTFYDSSNKDVELHFVQTEGSSFDNSDRNGLLLASNFLGSTDSSIDRSMAGRGFFIRRPDGQLREITLDDNDQIVVYSV